MKIKMFVMCLMIILISSCGYTQRDSELIGQVKKVTNETPIICPDYVAADISMGIMRNGVGSMSTEDVHVLIPNSLDMIKIFKTAAVSGKLVKVTYDTKRIALCTCDRIAKSVSYVDVEEKK